MAPSTYADVVNYTLLAVGAAMFLGTALALLAYRRNGVFPGQPVDDDGAPTRPPALRAAYVKMGVGLLVVLWGLAGLTSGSVAGF